jgi:hypothetical protein
MTLFAVIKIAKFTWDKVESNINHPCYISKINEFFDNFYAVGTGA